MNKRIINAFALLVTIPVLASAAPVNRQQAQQTALQFMNEKGMKSQTAEMAYRAPRRGQTAEENAYYYVFNASDNGGFVIVSGDDRTEEVLGYAYEGSFDEAALPAHIKSFLQTYADEIQHLDDTNVTESQRAPRREARQDYDIIAPLVTCHWDQGSPYSDLCPQKYPTGCAATSAAQVMYHHKWPAATTAEIPSYRTSTRRLYLPAIPDSTVINWEAMTDTYSRSSNAESRRAVAELMLYVGQSIKMDYDFMGSGAMSCDMGPAYNKYFDYQVTYLSRENYTLYAFEDSIYNQLADNCPVVFNGYSTGGGHSFVIDGYDGDHYFHVNWGWGGTSDGNFLLSVLNPYNTSSIGASSSEDGFSYGQDVLFLKPGYQTPVDPQYFKMSLIGVTDKGVLVEYYSLISGSNTFVHGLADLAEDGSISPLANTLKKENISQYYGEEDKEIRVSGLAEGLHRLVPIYRLASDSVWTYATYPYAEVNVGADGSLDFNTVWNKMETVDYIYESNLFINKDQSFSVCFYNNSDQEYYGPIYFFSNRGEGKSASGSAAHYEGYTILPHDSLRISYTFRPNSGGKWTLSFASDLYGKCIMGSDTVFINSGDASVDGVRYKLDPDNHEAKVVNGSEEYEGDILIPDTIEYNSLRYAVTKLDKNAFNGCTGIKSVSLPATLTEIGETCFEDCSGIKTLRIPVSVAAIGLGAFAGCDSLTEFQVDDNNIKYSASGPMLFSHGGKVLNSYPSAKGILNNLPDTLTTIGDGSFNKTGITRIVLPENIKTLGMICFNDCKDLTEIVSKARKAPSSFSGSNTSAFAGLDFEAVTVTVPAGTEDAYAKASGWKSFSYFRIFKDFGERSIQGFSASRNVDLSGVTVVNEDFDAVENASTKAYKVVRDSISGYLCALPIEGIAAGGNGMLIDGESILIFDTRTDSVSADFEGNVLLPALVDTDLSTISNAYTYSNGEFVANSSDIIEAGGAYLVLDDATEASLHLYFDEIPGGIQTISVDAADGFLYDLQGRKVSAPKSGLYILNGKKVLYR